MFVKYNIVSLLSNPSLKIIAFLPAIWCKDFSQWARRKWYWNRYLSKASVSASFDNDRITACYAETFLTRTTITNIMETRDIICKEINTWKRPFIRAFINKRLYVGINHLMSLKICILLPYSLLIWSYIFTFLSLFHFNQLV